MRGTIVANIAVAVSVFGLPQTAFAQDSTAPGGASGQSAGYQEVPQFGGPASVGAQVRSDDAARRKPYRFEGLSRSLQPYYDFKTRINEGHGFAFGADYAALYQVASDSPGEDDAAGGVLRLFGNWTLAGRGTSDAGSLVFKVENRHRLGTDIAPQDLGFEAGYAGLTAITFSDAGTLLTNLYWQQSFSENRFAFVAGIVDTTDYVDVYGLVNPWTDFSNLAFSTNPAIPAPNQGLGAAVRGTFADNYYVLAGLADANGDPSDPVDGLDTFFGDREYFAHIEAGWFSSWEDRFTDNIHLTAWHADERTAAGVDDGWGAAFSFSRKFDDRWLPFVRAGYSDGGGALMERSVSAGVGYFATTRADVLGFGLNWGRASKQTLGPGLDDQYTAELFYRLQLFPHMTVTPDLQLLVNPALNPQEDRIWIAGLRARLSF